MDLSSIRERLRKEYLTTENIAKEAYYIWLESGQPDGEQPFLDMKLKEFHWYQAQLRLEMLIELDSDFLNFQTSINVVSVVPNKAYDYWTQLPDQKI